MNPKVIFLGIDLYDLGYVSKIPDIHESKGIGRANVVPSDFSIDLKNFDNTFSEDYGAGLLNNVKWLYSPVKVYDSEGLLIIDGIAKDIPCDDKTKTATLQGSDILFQKRKTAIAYVSSAWETPAAALLNIFAAESFTNYNPASLQKSHGKQNTEGLKIKVNILKGDDVTIFDVIESLCKYGCADAWSHLGNVYYQHWQKFTGGVAFTVEYHDGDDCPMSAPTISRLENDFLNEYYISHDGDGGTPATDAANNNIGLASRTAYGELQWGDLRSDSVDTKQYTVKDLTAAVHLGESRVKRCHRDIATFPRPLRMIEHDLNVRYKNVINIGTFYRVIHKDQGWDGKIFEVYEYTRNEDSQIIKIKSLEVE